MTAGRDNVTLLINIVVYQLSWIACILGGADGMPLLGVGVVAVAVAYHLYRADDALPELILICAAAIIGAVWDSLLVAAGWLVYPSGTLISGTAPYWIVALWVVFATTLNVSLRWFKQHLLLAALFGALGGPLAYYAGARLGGVSFTDTGAALTALGLGWMALMPSMLLLARRYNGYPEIVPARTAAAGGGG
ncbi:MAG TPA: DUF2878 domain-containing protein [Gammaproteobacteria bacterium]|nr:DUF2878 domain-containing protein [Gammaproteobacteria bacterium]